MYRKGILHSAPFQALILKLDANIKDNEKFKCFDILTCILPGPVVVADEGVRLWCCTGLLLLDFPLLPAADRSFSLLSPGGVVFFSPRLFESSLLERSLLPDDRLLQLSVSLGWCVVPVHAKWIYHTNITKGGAKEILKEMRDRKDL